MGVAKDIRKNFNLFVDGRGYAGNTDEANMPELALQTEEYRAGGMDASIDITMGMEKLVADFTLNSHSKDVLSLFGVKEGKETAFTVREAMESYDGTVTAVVHNLRGKIVKINQGTSKAGEAPKDKYDLSLTYYKQTIGGQVIHEVDEASGKNTVTLKRTYGGVSQIVMREPTVQDLLTADMQVKNGSNAEKEVMMFANLCEVTPEFIKGLGVGSYERLQESYRLFTS